MTRRQAGALCRAAAGLAVLSCTGLCGQTAMAADMPLKAPPPVAASGNWYFSIDGMGERVQLPSYGLGIHNIDVSGVDLGPAQKFDPRLNGAGMRGTLGYMLPSSLRFEIGGSYVAAEGSSSGATTPGPDVAPAVLLNGADPGGVRLGGLVCAGIRGFTCTTTGTLNTNYAAWQIDGKLAFDRKFGTVTVAPSVAIFGGTTRDGQSLSQAFTQFFAGAVSNTDSYFANTTLHWTDAGGRFGLDVKLPLTGAVTFAIGGWVGGASRTASLSGSDVNTSSVAGFIGASTVSATASRGVLLANGEIGLAQALSAAATLRGFAGVNFDGSVPGLLSSGFSGTTAAPAPRAAGIAYAAETDFYAGAGFQVRF